MLQFDLSFTQENRSKPSQIISIFTPQAGFVFPSRFRGMDENASLPFQIGHKFGHIVYWMDGGAIKGMRNGVLPGMI